MTPPDGGALQLRGYLRTLRRHQRLILLVTVGVMACAAIATLLQPAVYEASAEILLQPRSTESVFDESAPDSGATPTVETEIRVIRSDRVRAAVRRAIGSAPKVSAERIGETEVMRITATSGDPRQAARVANAYADAYVDLRKSQAVGDLEAASEQIRGKIDALQAQIDDLVRQLSQAAPGERAAVEATVGPRYTTLLEEQGLLAQKLNSLEVDATLKSGGAQLVRVADVPDSPANRQLVRNVLGALLVGLVLGFALAFLREHMDDSIRTKDDLVVARRDLPVLGIVPVIENWEGQDPAAALKDLHAGVSPAAEAYRSLRTSVQLLGVERPVRTVQVTSPAAGEGKTTLVANLAVAMASASRRVVTVDADLRRPALHEMFGVTNDVGLTSVFAGDVDATSAVRPVAVSPSLFIVPSGPIPANPLELLSSDRMARFLFDLQGEYDVVLVDSAPVLPVTDAVVLAAWVEGTVLVTAAGVTTGRAVAEAAERLAQVDARLVGTILNRATAEATYGYGYGYGYGYAAAGTNGGPERPGQSGRRGTKRPGQSGGNGPNGSSRRPRSRPRQR